VAPRRSPNVFTETLRVLAAGADILLLAQREGGEGEGGGIVENFEHRPLPDYAASLSSSSPFFPICHRYQESRKRKIGNSRNEETCNFGYFGA